MYTQTPNKLPVELGTPVFFAADAKFIRDEEKDKKSIMTLEGKVLLGKTTRVRFERGMSEIIGAHSKLSSTEVDKESYEQFKRPEYAEESKNVLKSVIRCEGTKRSDEEGAYNELPMDGVEVECTTEEVPYIAMTRKQFHEGFIILILP
jgi:hypothetical protein